MSQESSDESDALQETVTSAPPKKTQYTREQKLVEKVYNLFRKIGQGSDGSVEGLNGSLSWAALGKVLCDLGVKDKHFIDMGMGEGRVVIAASYLGARISEGYELPINTGHKHIFDGVLQAIKKEKDWPRDAQCSYHYQNIKEINNLSNVQTPACVYTFWKGMEYDTQEHILKLCGENQNIESILVFYNSRTWTRPDQVEVVLENFSNGSKWDLASTHKVKQFASRPPTSHTCWIFRRRKDQTLQPDGEEQVRMLGPGEHPEVNQVWVGPEGIRYDGRIENGLPHGKGVLSQNGKVLFRGIFENGNFIRPEHLFGHLWPT